MTKQFTTAAARRDWAKVLRCAERGTPVEVLRNGQPVAVVVSVEEYRRVRPSTSSVFDIVTRFREGVDPRDLEGPDPWADLRDRSVGRPVEIG